jgi:NADPH:quinone reductase-like Zn-dependent oxidoreductase
VNPVTVVGMLDVLSIPAGEYIVQSAAGSVLGRQLITVAKKRGIKTINIIRRAEQADELLAIGADHVIVSTEVENVAAKVMEITGGKGAWGGIDAVAGDMTAIITGSTRAGGTVLVYGAMSGIAYTGSVVDTLFRNVTTRGFWLNIWLGSLTPERKAEVFSEVLGMLADGSLVPLVGESFPLKDVVAAVAHSQAPARGGKVILVSE